VYIDNTIDGPTPGDVDFFTFTGLTPGTPFAVRTVDPLLEEVDTRLGWFSSTGLLLTANDDEEEGILTSRIEGTVPTGGSLTFAVTGVDDPTFMGTHFEGGTYELRLQLQSAGLMGDYNGNNVVDVADYVVWRNTLGQTGTGLAADGNNNNVIDSGDYNTWRTNFGRTTGGSGANAGLSSSAIPEPASLALMASAAAYVLMQHRRGDR
jgi:hypothetical protein